MFIMQGYQEFVKDTSMIKRLYGEENEDEGETKQSKTEDDQDLKNSINDEKSVNTIFRTQLEKRKEFQFNYCSYLLATFFKYCCCCLTCCCRKKNRCRRLIKSYEKFQLAKSRLYDEQDIQYLIEMNRITRLIHKATFFWR